jgi:seryl-tRNA synthetase
MLNINQIRDNPNILKESLTKRGLDPNKVDEFLSIDSEWKNIKKQTEELRAERNKISVDINESKKQGKDISNLIKKSKELPIKIQEKETLLKDLESKRDYTLENFPNIVDKSVPVGDATKNKVVFSSGKPLKLKFPAKGHEELLLNLDAVNIDKAAKVSGARFYYLKREIVKLNMAIINFALDNLNKKGFILMQPPFMLNRSSLNSALPLAAFEEMIYKIENEDLYLIGTAEHALNAYYIDETVRAEDLPIRLAGISTCFRKEAGSHGKDTKGIFRVHQFEKIEQFVFCKPENSWKEFDLILNNSKDLLKKLKIPFRFVVLSSQDMGKVPTKTVDFEGWFPSQKEYRELGSCSNCLDYQSRRANTKYEEKGSRIYVNTLNNTAIATERMIACIVENYQLKDGSIKIPTVLVPYMNGLKKISPVSK